MTATATYYVVSGGNDCTWRAEWPAQAVGGRVAKIPQADVDRALLAPNNDTALPWRILAKHAGGRTSVLETARGYKRFNARPQNLEWLTAQFPAHEGTAVFVRPCLARATLAKAMRLQGIRTVAEADDNYFAPPNQNLFSRTQGADEQTHAAHAMAMASLGVNVFSTGWLRDRYQKEYRRRFGKQGLPELHVCRNHIPRENWPEPADYDGPVRVGFMGSPSHVWDLSALGYTSFHAAKQLGARTVVIGYNPADPDPDQPDSITVDGEEVMLRSEESIRVRGKWREVVDEHVRWIDPADYHRVPLPLDIGICPLLYNDFNTGKSDIKAIEMVVSGAVPVVSGHPVYTSSGWKHQVNCLVGGSAEELALAVVRLVKDEGLRAELLTAGREMVEAERGTAQLRAEWGAALAL